MNRSDPPADRPPILVPPQRGVAAPPGAPPPPGGSGPSQEEPAPPYWRMSQLVIPDASASASSQAITYLVAVYPIGMVAHAADAPGAGVAIALSLLAGVIACVTTRTSRFFRQVPGMFLGVMASVATAIALAFISSGVRGAPADGDMIAVLIFGVGAFVTGLDWGRVGRLRAVPVLAAIPVLLVAAGGDGSNLAVSVGWLALAVAALWSLELDQRKAFSAPRSLTPHPERPDDVGSRDLAGALGLALLLGLLFAFSASMPSCSANIPGLGRFGFDGPDVRREIPFDTDRLSLDDIRFGNFPFDWNGDLPSIDINGVEHILREGASGMLYLENLLTGERYEVRRENGNLVARDEFGTVIAVIRPMEAEPPEGSPSSIPWRNIVVVAAVVLAAGLATWWYLKRRKPPASSEARQWAEDMVARLDRFGRGHGTPRSRSETVGQHSHALTRSVVHDARLIEVARVVSDALFDREQPTMDRRIWAEQVIDEIIDAHPPPGPVDRLRRRKRTSAER